MPSFTPPWSLVLSSVILLALLASPTVAFGAGNIASIARIEGTNWRHGDIEDTLLNILMSRAAGGKKFSKMDVKRVYFGNWLRDYSQAVDVGTVKYVSAEAIRLILWVLGFMSFGYGTKEFEVTTDRLGCYRPEEHIDNPKDYADNIDARQYHRRLRAPVDERRELAVNPQTGLKNYIATENIGIATSAGLVRDLFGRSIQLGRRYARSNDKADLYEALRLLGTGCHCLEDYSAHSNYTELALIELGERSIFPHVGRRTQMELPGVRQPVFPLITGTFGGVDFLHSVMGEFSDKATQSEIQELEGTMQNSGQADTSMLQDLLNQVPSGLFGDKDEAGKVDELQANATAAQMQNSHISPREPEAWAEQLDQIQKQIYPIIEWHDELMQSISEAIENIPILPTLLDQLTEQLNMFVFSLMAPLVVPVISQVKTELNTGSSEIIQSSNDKQLIVFHDDNSTDPTHSMLSKDHFSNILNEPAGKVASQVLKWVVPQLIACWDDERIDVDRTLNRVIYGTFHHPALRDYGEDGAEDGRRLMFGVVEQWWREKDEHERQGIRGQLSREGVEQGRNHKPGVQDTGHGCCKPLGMPTVKTSQSSGAVGGLGGLAGGAVLGEIGDALSGQSKYDAGYTGGGGAPSGGSDSGGIGKLVEGVVGGGVLGAIGGELLGGDFSGSNAKKQSHQSQQYEADGSYTQSFTETGYSRPQRGQQKYGQAEYSQTSFAEGGQREQYQRYEQDDQYGRSGYGQQVVQESRPTYGGGYEQTTEKRYEKPGGAWESEVRVEGRETASGGYYEETKRFSGRGGNRNERVVSEEADEGYGRQQQSRRGHKKNDSDDDSNDGDDSDEKRRKKEKKNKKKKHGSGDGYEGGDGGSYGGGDSGYGGRGGDGGGDSGYGGRGGDGGGDSGYGGRGGDEGGRGYGGGSGYEGGGQQTYGGGGSGYSGGGDSGYQERRTENYEEGSGYGGGGYGGDEQREQSSGYGGGGYGYGQRNEYQEERRYDNY